MTQIEHKPSLMKNIFHYVKKNAVMFIALAAAIITSFIVPPDKAYLDYFDLKTLTCLFCVLAVVCALRNIRFFYALAQKIVQLFINFFKKVFDVVSSIKITETSVQYLVA